jgi:hypothetical protein
MSLRRLQCFHEGCYMSVRSDYVRHGDETKMSDKTTIEPNALLAEVRAAYGALGIEIADEATYGLYSRLRCQRCHAPVGMIGDKLLPGLIPRLLEQSRELYANGSLGCACGFQAERAKTLGEATPAT